MLKILNTINLGKDTENNFKESKLTTIIKWFMEKMTRYKLEQMKLIKFLI